MTSEQEADISKALQTIQFDDRLPSLAALRTGQLH